MALLQVDGARIAYDEYGRGTKGDPIVLLHACALSRHMWEFQAEALRGAHHVVAPDMRGHGSSDVPSFVTSIERMAADVRALVESLEMGPAILVGHGMGGYVALQYARDYPDDVRALVLTNARTRPDSKEDVAQRYRLACLLREQGPGALADEMLPKLLSKEARGASPEVVADVRRVIETTSAAGIASALSALASPPDWSAILPEISAPTLVVAGGADERAVADARETSEAIPGARLSVVEGSGSLVNLEKPDAFLETIKEFLASLEPAEPAERDAAAETAPIGDPLGATV